MRWLADVTVIIVAAALLVPVANLFGLIHGWIVCRDDERRRADRALRRLYDGGSKTWNGA